FDMMVPCIPMQPIGYQGWNQPQEGFVVPYNPAPVHYVAVAHQQPCAHSPNQRKQSKDSRTLGLTIFSQPFMLRTFAGFYTWQLFIMWMAIAGLFTFMFAFIGFHNCAPWLPMAGEEKPPRPSIEIYSVYQGMRGLLVLRKAPKTGNSSQLPWIPTQPIGYQGWNQPRKVLVVPHNPPPVHYVAVAHQEPCAVPPCQRKQSKDSQISVGTVVNTPFMLGKFACFYTGQLFLMWMAITGLFTLLFAFAGFRN
ncbi:hypothetical protein HPB47_017457, partial [Ixodes persulcatus]